MFSGISVTRRYVKFLFERDKDHECPGLAEGKPELSDDARSVRLAPVSGRGRLAVAVFRRLLRWR